MSGTAGELFERHNVPGSMHQRPICLFLPIARRLANAQRKEKKVAVTDRELVVFDRDSIPNDHLYTSDVRGRY